jgi:hypothetical protein
MTFMITFSLPIDTIEERTSRFLETGGPPPAGVEMVGRWHAVSAARGWVLAKTNDSKALFRWIRSWADLMEFEIEPVLDDQEAAALMQEPVR